jgi:hypothetical protein
VWVVVVGGVAVRTVDVLPVSLKLVELVGFRCHPLRGHCSKRGGLRTGGEGRGHRCSANGKSSHKEACITGFDCVGVKIDEAMLKKTNQLNSFSFGKGSKTPETSKRSNIVFSRERSAASLKTQECKPGRQ